ncbi:MAG: DnaA N-terminal domain-containing protein, partial [Thermogutta sp.]
MDDMDIVSALRRAVADRVGRERFHLWFGESAQFLWDGVRVFVIVPNQFYLDWLRTRFRKHVDEGCAAVLGYSPPIDFRLKPPAKTDSRPSLFAQPEVLQANLRLDGSHPPVTSRQGRQATAVTLDDGAASQSRSDEGLEDRSARDNSADYVLESTGAAASRPAVPTACPEVIAVAANANANDSGIKAGRAAAQGRQYPGETTLRPNSDRAASRLTSDGQRTKPPVQPLLFPMDDEPGETRSEVIAASASCCGMSSPDSNGSGKAEGKDVSPVASEILAICDKNAERDGTPSATASRSKIARRGRKFADLRDFVVGQANQFAFAAAETVGCK